MTYFKRKILASICWIFSYLIILPLQANPWVESDDAYLRSDLQLLSDAGLISVPVNTFPLPWREISEQIINSSPNNLSDNVRSAYFHLRYKINAAKEGYGNNSLKLKASQESIPSSYGSRNDVKWGVFSSAAFDELRFAMKISANYAQYYDKENFQYNLDDSYFAVTTGKTNFFISTQNQWWSPSWIQSLSAEQRIHPSYELGMEKTFIDLPAIGNIYVKSGINQLRSSDDWKYSWRSRLSLRPTEMLELSLTRFDFMDSQNNDVEEHDYQTSTDARLSLFSITDLPLGIYTQYIINDSQSEFNDYLLGSDYSVRAYDNQIRFVFEYSHIDEKYSRYSLGTYVQMENDHQWQLFLHRNNTESNGNQLVGAYRFLLYKGMLSLSFLFSDAEFSDPVNAGISWELRF